MARQSSQHKLDRVRPPRVTIVYDFEIENAIKIREIPFVIGVLGDFSGSGRSSRLKDRNFYEVDTENFNDVLAAIRPKLQFLVTDSSDSGRLEVSLEFAHIEDFEPENVIKQVQWLRVMVEHDHSPQTQRSVWSHLDRILHAPQFQQLEASWRALWYLVLRTETSPSLKIKILDVTKKELLRDFQRAPEFDQSALLKKLYEEPYGIRGGDPFGLLIGDYHFTPSAEDVELLRGISLVAFACLAPFIAAAGPQMFGIENFEQLEQSRDLGKVFDSADFGSWKIFRQDEASRYVGLVLPRILMRPLYGLRPAIPSQFHYEEAVGCPLWGNSAYALGARVARAFAAYGWCADFRGVERGGLVDGLPTWKREDGEKSGIEVLIKDRREKELADLGFIALVHCKGTECGAFFSAQTCSKPRLYDRDAANANSRLSCQLPYILVTSRFGHYIRAIVRDCPERWLTRADWERRLNRWIVQYVTQDDSASAAIKAQFPLREARIDVTEIPGRPGVHRAVAFLRPHFQLDELSASLRLIANLPAL